MFLRRALLPKLGTLTMLRSQSHRWLSSVGPPAFGSASGMLSDLLRETEKGATRRNYVGVLTDMTKEGFTVTTDLFPQDALDFYTLHNLNQLDEGGKHKDLYAKFYNEARGGGQGDYRAGLHAKIDNVVDCLTKFPRSKRAIVTVPYAKQTSDCADHTDDEQAKCLRELHFYVEDDGKVHCTGFMRAQAASIFPKNIHYIGSMLATICDRLGRQPGTYTHIVTTLVDDRAN
jgi:hypothetical protein